MITVIGKEAISFLLNSKSYVAFKNCGSPTEFGFIDLLGTGAFSKFGSKPKSKNLHSAHKLFSHNKS